jgi:hypothetical protein
MKRKEDGRGRKTRRNTVYGTRRRKERNRR